MEIRYIENRYSFIFSMHCNNPKTKERRQIKMVRSMTAFGRAVSGASVEGKNITVEMKSVNNRFLDCSVRISRIYSFLEERVRNYIRQSGISRGKLDISISVEITENIGATVNIDKAYAKSYIEALRELRDEFSLTDDISVMTVAQNRDVFLTTRPEEDTESDWQCLKPVLDEAIAAFIKAREIEGERLKADIFTKIEKIEALAEKIKAYSEDDISNYKERFEARLKSIIEEHGLEINQQMLLTECAIYADRVAIDEELVRLGSHFKSFGEIFDSKEPIGRKLDFLL